MKQEGLPMKTYRIAAIPGDGIGTEVVSAGVEVLEALAARDGGFAMAFDHFDWGGDYYKRHGRMMPEDGREQIRRHDAILFGSAGHPDIPDHITLWGLRLAICQPFDQYANVRPTRILPGITSPLRHVTGPELDWVIVRENSEGEYAGVGGRVHQGLPIEAATDVSMMTRAGVTRIMRFAFKLAQSRPRKLLTVVTKSNAQRYAMVMWDEIAVEVAKEFPDVTWDKAIVDAMTMRMTLKPETIDTVVATNLHADILSDLAAAPRRLARDRADRQPQPGARVPVHVRAHPRLGLRHHGQGRRQSGRHLLVGLDDARPSRRADGWRPADARHRARHRRPGPAHAGPRRQGDDAAGDRCGHRRHQGRQRIAGRRDGLWQAATVPSMPRRAAEVIALRGMAGLVPAIHDWTMTR
jgi:tartrate dehydrogenase/decarboxylase/D-malate dehydrogenase